MFLLTFFGPPPFSMFLSLSLSSSCPFFLSFLSFFFPLFWFLVFVSFFPFLSSLPLFHERTTSNSSIPKFSFVYLFCLFGFLSSFLFETLFSYLCFVCWFKVMFLFNIIVLGFKKQVEKHQFLVKRGLQQTVFSYEPVFSKMWKVIIFGAIFWANFGWCSKEHYKNRYFSTFKKAKNRQKKTIFKVNNWAKLKSIIGPSWGSKKKPNLAQLLTLKICARLFYF